MITEPNSILELLGLGKQCEQRITESLTKLLLELYSVIWAEELPNRNCFRIKSVIISCVMVQQLVPLTVSPLKDNLSPRKHYLPETKCCRIIFRLPFHDFDFFELILENYPIPIVFVRVV